MTNRNQIWQSIELELRRSKNINPSWPDHVVAQAAFVSEASGKLLKGSIDYKYGKSKAKPILDAKKETIRQQAINSAVMAIRFLENLK